MTRETREVIREEPLMRDRLLELLGNGPMTVPDLAAAGGLPPEEVMVWVMGMRRYGYVSVEKDPTDDGYYRYAALRRP
jgi:DNA-binding IclR family transcriptional regulator